MPTTSRFRQVFAGLHVIVVGDVILDSYCWGRADRISPEAPVPVLLHEGEEHRLGGAANVALNLAAMGAVPHLVSVLGDDAQADIFEDLMRHHDLDCQGLLRSSQRPTTVKTRFMARHQQLLRWDREKNFLINSEETERICEICVNIASRTPVHALLFQDYDKGVLSIPLLQRLQSWADFLGIPTAVDPKKRHFLHYQGATLFKPNLREVNEGLGLSISEREPDVAELEFAALRIRQILNNRYTLITLGARGMYLHGAEGGTLLPARERSVADVCGAGDTVIALAALGLAAGWDMKTAALLANLGGGLVCEYQGVVPVDADRLWKEWEREWSDE